jgi:hypothetical protein
VLIYIYHIPDAHDITCLISADTILTCQGISIVARSLDWGDGSSRAGQPTLAEGQPEMEDIDLVLGADIMHDEMAIPLVFLPADWGLRSYCI